MSAHLLLPSPFQREQWPFMRDSSRKCNEIFGDRKAIDLHEVNERQLLGASRVIQPSTGPAGECPLSQIKEVILLSRTRMTGAIFPPFDSGTRCEIAAEEKALIMIAKGRTHRST